MIRWFWRIWSVLLLATVLFHHAGEIEGKFYPVLQNVKPITNSVVRTGDKLCWGWEADKVRPATIDTLDGALDRPAINDRSWPEIYDKATGLGWHKKGGHPAMHIVHNDCVLIPAGTASGEPLRLTQQIHYNSDLGPWTVPMPLPTIDDPGVPGPLQDRAPTP